MVVPRAIAEVVNGFELDYDLSHAQFKAWDKHGLRENLR